MNNHMEVWQQEMASQRDDNDWNAWAAQAEHYLANLPGWIGTLDADESVSGYSLDSAYSAYRAGIKAYAYAMGQRAA